jgi:hypothetical protein
LAYTIPFFPPIVGEEVNLAQENALQSKLNNGDTIRIGDSVGRNINPDLGYSDGVLNLCSNAGIGLIGNLLLIKQVLNRNSQIDSIEIEGYLLPSTFKSNLEGTLTLNYFIKKFENDNWMFDEQIISNKTMKEINSTFLSRYENWISPIRVLDLNGKSPLYYYKIGPNIKGQAPRINLFEYIVQTDELRHLLQHIKFLPMPVPNNRLNEQLENAKYIRSFGINYPDPIGLPDEYFNGTHLKGKYKKRAFYDNILIDLKNEN